MEIPLVFLSKSKSYEKEIITRHHLCEDALIRCAASEAYDAVCEEIRGKRILVLAGPGNSGMDALYMTKLMIENGEDVRVFPVLLSKFSDEAKRVLNELKDFVTSTLEDADVYIDGIFGIQMRRELPEEVEEIIEKANQKKEALRIALDLPTAFRFLADITVTFGFFKTEEFLPTLRRTLGRIIYRNPGFPEEDLMKGYDDSFLLDINADLHLTLLPLDAYKKTRGHVLVMGGSDEYPGAPVLSSVAAFHASAGLVTLVSTESVLLGASFFPSIIRRRELDARVEYDSAVLGPGWVGDHRKEIENIRKRGIFLVLDAGAFHSLRSGIKFSGNAVLTPHIGEFKRLLESYEIEPFNDDSAEDLMRALKALSREAEAVVLLKGAVTFITDVFRLRALDGATPEAGVAGSGDVLSGIIAAIYKRAGCDPFRAAVSGAVIHMRASRIAKRELGFFPSEEIIKRIRTL